jgi:nucleotide-binding universal stress UspA family protein
MAYQNVLCPSTAAPPPNRGLKEAIELAKAVGARLTVLHVVENAPLITAPEAATYLPQLIDDLREAAQRSPAPRGLARRRRA